MATPQLQGRVLLVEDTRDVRKVIARFIEFTGLEVIGCESGEAALSEVDARPFQMAIIDIGLPGMDGMETLQELRRRGHQFPCLALSGNVTPSLLERWVQLSGQGFIRKPVARRMLQEQLERWLAPMGNATHGSGALQSRFVAAMVDASRDLRSAVVQRDRKRVTEIAHRMKGTCGAFKASEVAEAAARVLRCVEASEQSPSELDKAFAEVAEAVGRLSLA